MEVEQEAVYGMGSCSDSDLSAEKLVTLQSCCLGCPGADRGTPEGPPQPCLGQGKPRLTKALSQRNTSGHTTEHYEAMKRNT